MVSPAESPPDARRRRPPNVLSGLSTSTFLSLLPIHKATPPVAPPPPPSKVVFPLRFDSPTHPDSLEAKSAASVQGHSESRPASGFPSTMRIAGLNSSVRSGGPAFVGQVFSMCDLSGTGLMAVSTHFDIPFLSSRLEEDEQPPLMSSLRIFKCFTSNMMINSNKLLRCDR